MSEPGVRSHWAFVERRTPIFSRPSTFSPKKGRLGLRTPERTDEVVYIDSRTANAAWYKVRAAGRKTGWVPRSRLGAPQPLSTHIIIDKSDRTLTLERAGETVYAFRIGIGQRAYPTPEGEFFIRTKLYGFKSPVYGPRAMGLSANSRTLTDWPGGGFIGIHGTNQPGLIPGAISHGCVRLRNENILRLFRKVSVGTPVTIQA
jgi:lipoprotein-anchoring transpeptidase ErfK/SrfK